ncbi:MAG TPA: hypothetical protein DEP35_12340 [Deltaproteobacteria bacterium]|nr:hypothetical protein [Deltaproteobacteria bacterium]
MPLAPLLLAILVLGAGALAGVLVGRSSSRAAAKRCRELEAELEASQAAFGKYRSEVGAHFGQTSELLRAMTHQYRAVYEHLAEGARTLCPDQVTSLGAGLDRALLPEEAQRTGEPTTRPTLAPREEGPNGPAPSTGVESDELELDPDEASPTTH